jgi:hypothetical protein
MLLLPLPACERPIAGPASPQPAPEAYAPGRSGPRAKVSYKLAGKRRPASITYEVIDGLAVAEGDIVLGRHAELARAAAERRACSGEVCAVQSPLVHIAGENYLWPGGVIPYEIDRAYTADERAAIMSGIALVDGATNVILKPREGESDFVRFRRVAAGCSSAAGRQGGRQTIDIQGIDDFWCSPGKIAHELMHAAGVWHEQSREDRDGFVRIVWENILDGERHNFEQHIGDGVDVAGYDYGSIMHYDSTAFGKPGASGAPSTTIEVLTAGAVIGQRMALSAGDVAGVNGLYASEDCIHFNPDRLLLTALGSQWRLDERLPDGRTGNMFIAGDTRAEADTTVALIRHYRIDQVCYVGRPDPSTTYFLASGSAPSGPFPGEDCQPLDPAASRVVNDGGWTIVNDTPAGRDYIAAFPNPGEAYRTLDTWRQRGFAFSCYLGRPAPAVTYFRN